MKIYSWLLSLYPRRFRDRFGAGMRTAFNEDYARARRRGRLGAAAFLATTFLHAILFAVAERLPRPQTVASFLVVDVRDGIRSLRSTPVVTAVAVLSLALGIGANTALFSILNSLVVRQLPVVEPERLVIVDRTDWTNPIWEQIRERQTSIFASACAWAVQEFDLAPAGRTDPIVGAYVSGGLFQMLGVHPIVGRAIAPSDDVRGGGPDGLAAVISYRLWQQRFGGAADIVGRQLAIERVSHTIVGVAPRGFFGPEVGQSVDLFIPIASEGAIRGPDSQLDGRSSWWLQVMGRLRRDQTIQSAAAALNAALPAIRDATMPATYIGEYRANYLKDEVILYPAANGVSNLRTRFEQPLTIIMIVVATVLLIACANIANLMLARFSARRHEMSVRLALGASRERLACQLFAESLVLATVGGVAGLALARTGATLLIHQLGSEVSRVSLDVPIDWRVLGFTAVVSLGATFIFGLAPAFGLGGVEPNDALKEQSRTVAGDRRFGLRNALVVAQVALSFALVAGAGLFVRTFTALTTTPLGFDPQHLSIVRVDARQSHLTDDTKAAFAQQVADMAAAVPGVVHATGSYLTPMSENNWTHRLQVEGGPTLSRAQQTAWFNAVQPGWFETYGMRVIAGRGIRPSDRRGSPAVAVVNEAFVRRFAGPGSPLGQRFRGVGLGKLEDTTIVGVVNDAVYRTVRIGIVPTVYLPMGQGELFGSEFFVTVKSAAERHSLEAGLADALRRVDPSLGFSFRDYSDQIGATFAQERLVAMMSGFFGVLATLLAALGLYGVTSYAVSRRRPEIAVRIALGASTNGVVHLVLRNVMILLACGGAIGLILSVWAARFVDTLLFHIDARDPVTLAAAAAVLVSVGLFAGWLPARRVSHMDPASALRG